MRCGSDSGSLSVIQCVKLLEIAIYVQYHTSAATPTYVTYLFVDYVSSYKKNLWLYNGSEIMLLRLLYH
jgi:hypothetical protein